MPTSPSSSQSLTDLAAPYRGSRCVVTGGLGFIGSNLAIALAGACAEVTIVDVLDPRGGGNPRNVEGADVEVVVADIGDAGAVADSLDGADYVFNLAGQVSHIDSMVNPVHDLDLNVRSHLSLLEMVRRSERNPRVVYASTRQVYGRPVKLPVVEEHPLHPVDVNGISKAAAESFHLLYHEIYEIPVTILRFSNVYGPRQRLAGDHQGFLPVFVRRVIEGEPITLFGDGSHERECLYVDDAVAALLTATTSDAAVGEVFNISHPQAHSLCEIAETLVEIAGEGEIQSRPWPEERERIAIGSTRVDSAKAQMTLGWRSQVDLSEGFARTLAFYRTEVET